jgi:hypothetical protein
VLEYASQVRDAMAAALDTAAGRTMVLSGEGVSHLESDELQALRDFLLERCDEVSVVAYVREPAGFMASRFQHRLRHGPIGFEPERDYPRYRRRFEKFDDVFGRDRVSLWKFEPRSLVEGCVVRDFCHRTGIPVPAKVVRVNESLSRAMVALYYCHRQFIDREEATRQLPSELRRAFPSEPFRFASDLVERVISENQEDHAWMEERLGESLTPSSATSRTIASEADLFSVAEELRGTLTELLPDGGAIPRRSGPAGIADLVQQVSKVMSGRREGANTRSIRKLAASGKEAAKTRLRVGGKQLAKALRTQGRRIKSWIISIG